MPKRLFLAAVAAVPLVAWAADPAPAPSRETTAQARPAPRIAQEKLDRIRHALVSQMAVWEASEQAMRAPTASEAAALNPAARPSTDTVLPVAGGGSALRPDISHASLAIAVRGDDGKVAVGHDLPAPRAPAVVGKGDARAR